MTSGPTSEVNPLELMIAINESLGRWLKDNENKLNDSANGLLAISQSISQFVDDRRDLFKDMLGPHGKEVMNITFHRHFYENDGKNILHAWKAIQIAQRCKFHQLPEWAVLAIAESAEDIVDITPTSSATLNKELKQATGINGHKINRFHANLTWMTVYWEIKNLNNEKGTDLKECFSIMSKKYELGAELTVENRYYEFKELFNLEGVGLESPFYL